MSEPLAVVLYQGFVHTDMDDDSDPSYDEVKHVADTFAKHSLKSIQKEHPLFARGSSEKLNLLVSGDVLKAESPKGVLFETQVTKIVYVAPLKKILYLVARRSPQPRRFSCHLFKLTSERLAADLSATLWTVIKTASRFGRLASVSI